MNLLKHPLFQINMILICSLVFIELIGYLGGSYDKFYGEISGVTNVDDVDWSAKAGVKFTF